MTAYQLPTGEILVIPHGAKVIDDMEALAILDAQAAMKPVDHDTVLPLR